MELKRKTRLVIELVVVASALPFLLLGCGGGGGGSTSADPNAGRVYGQFWTDLTSASGVLSFLPGVTGRWVVEAVGDTTTASFSSGAYHISGPTKKLVGGSWVPKIYNSYYLQPSGGWAPMPTTFSFVASNATHYSMNDAVYGLSEATISTIDLSGLPIVANSAVPAVTADGVASAVLPNPVSAFYPPGSYEYDIVTSGSMASPRYVLSVYPDWSVSVHSGSPNPINASNFNRGAFAAHTTTSDPFCVNGMAWVYSGPGVTGDIFNIYALSGAPAGAIPTCLNASIAVGATSSGSYELSFTTMNGVPLVVFSNPGGTYLTIDVFGTYIIGALPADNTVYSGYIIPSGSSVSTGYLLNKTAMDAALGAWGVPMF